MIRFLKDFWLRFVEKLLLFWRLQLTRIIGRQRNHPLAHEGSDQPVAVDVVLHRHASGI